MKKFALLITVFVFCAVALISVGAYDYYGKVMPDYVFVADSMTQSASSGAVTDGMVYDADTDRIYSGFLVNTSASVPSDGTYIQINIPSEVTASRYRFIKIGYRGLTENDTSEKNVDVNLGIGGTRFWATEVSSSPSFAFDGEHRETVIDASIFKDGESYNGQTNPGYDGINEDDTYSYIRIKPWGSNSVSKVDHAENDYIKLEYVAFFETQEQAEAYTTARYNYDVTSGTTALAAYTYGTSTMRMDAYRSADDTVSFPYMRFIPTIAAGQNAPESLMFQLSTTPFASFDISETPIFQFSYRTNIASSNLIDFNLGVTYGPDNVTARIWGPRVNFTSDGEWHTVTLNLPSLNYTGGDGNYYAPADGETIWGLVNNVTYARIKPYNSKLIRENEYFDVLYYGFFSSVSEARKFTPTMPKETYSRGDANGDIVITPADEIVLSRLLTDPELAYKASYDVNGDTLVNAIDHAVLARHIAGWAKYQSLYTSYAEQDLIDSLDQTFEERRDEILNSESEWELGEGGEIFYVSPNGSDSNNGKSESTPWKTTANLTSSRLSAGDVVLFERGGVWREKWTAVAGVTYSAYGEGKKPAFYGSVDGSNPDDWEEVSENLWKFTPRTFSLQSADVGCIIFNHGEAYGARVLTQNGYVLQVGMNGITSNGIETWESRKYGLFAGESELNHDLEYYLNPSSNYLFVYSDKGNPADRFDSIELSIKGNIISGRSNCVFDNLTVKYGASHGIGMGTVSNVTVRNCEVGWIGGAIQNLAVYGEGGRFGNGIEIFGSSDNFLVYNNYVYECFDCGVTVQYQNDDEVAMSDGTKITQFDNHFYDNVVERCNSPLESWITHHQPAQEDTFMFMSNVVFEENLCRRSGWGFGGYIHTKTDNNMFYGGEDTSAIMVNCFIRNNTMWDIRNLVILAVPTTTNYGKGFIWKDNTIIKEYGSNFARIAANLVTTSEGFSPHSYTDTSLSVLEHFKILGSNNFMSFIADDEE
ncbi:MAG: right-handed parallel beta-helix repeat-containing protein [Clostridia bacterium]|nr:right-handed parallel beta-helix repeat-containing protein [Clostridia bacterium]